MVDSLRPLSDLVSPAARAMENPPVYDAAPRPGGQAPGQAGPDLRKKLFIRVPSEDDPVLKRISLILTMFPGSRQMIIWCEKEKKRLGARCLIHEGLVLELKELLGEENVVVK